MKIRAFIMKKLLMSMLILSVALSLKAGVYPVDLRCDHRSDPVGVEKAHPPLAWRIDSEIPGVMQEAYQIQVASSAEALLAGEPDLWDTGRIASGVSLGIPYGGKERSSREAAYWRVRIWTKGAEGPGDWSDVARWEMALLEPEDWRASWIRGPEVDPVSETDALRAWMYGAAYIRGEGPTGSEPQRRPSDWEPGVELSENAERLRALEPATWLRKEFAIEKEVVRARLYSTAAGYADFYLNGEKIAERIRNPGQTDFEKRILYDIDVLDGSLEPGSHTLSAHLGQGFYGQNAGFSPTQFFYGRPAIIAQLEIDYADGTSETLVSDGSWETHPSRVVKNNIFAGEVYDATRSMEGTWAAAEVLETSPTERLEMQALPPVKAIKPVEPVELLQPAPGVWVFDFGQNFTGYVEMDLSRLGLPEGEAVWLRFAEWSDDEGNIGMNSGGGWATRVNQVDAYIAGRESSGKWRPSFTWHGFRYVEVTGLEQEPDLELLTGYLVRSAVPVAGTFHSSSEHLNRVHRTALWTYESNLVSIPMDCPIRERCGWTGDAHAALTYSNFNYDMALFWEKYLGDFRTNERINPAIVPGKRQGVGHVDWPLAQVLIAGEHYRFHSGTEVVRDHYAQLLEFMDHFDGRRTDGIVSDGYGDWCDPVRTPGDERVGGAGRPQQTPPVKTSTALFVKSCLVMEELAHLMNDQANAAKFASWRGDSIEAFHREFFDAEAGSYGSQTADAMALSFGIVPDDLRATVAEALNRDVLENWNGHASVGALGHRWLYPALADNGYADTALGTFFAEGHPGFSYLFDELNGTSLWERKGAFNPATMEEPNRSLSHPFQGGYDAWFYLGLGGIRPDWSAPGFKRVVLKPAFPDALDWVEVDYPSGYGLIRSHWKREGNELEWTVNIPPNTSATLALRRDDVSEVSINGETIPSSALFPNQAEVSSYSLPNGSHMIRVAQ